MPVLTPDLFHATLQELLDCVCIALDIEAECKCPCRKYVSAGPPAWDDCCEGQLTVWLEDVFYHDNFPSRISQAQVCSSFLAGTVVLQLLRCAPVMDDQGNPPNHLALSDSARKIYQEMYIALKALACCLAIAKRHRKYVITGAKVIGPDGGCVGFEIRISLELHDPMPDIVV